MYWNPVIEKEKIGIEEQKKNERLLREREESKMKITDTGIYFLPQGENNSGKTPTKKTENKTEQKKLSVDKRSSDYKRLNQDIEEKVDFLYRFIKNAYNVDTSEYSEAVNSVFVPYYQDNSENEKSIKKSEYIPDYKINDIIYRGFYESRGQRTAIIKYEGRMNYLITGKFLGKTTLSVHSIETDSVVFRDNKSGEDIIIEK